MLNEIRALEPSRATTKDCSVTAVGLPIAISHMLRPWVAIRSFSPAVPGLAIAMSNTATTGRPVPNGDQFAPPSMEE